MLCEKCGQEAESITCTQCAHEVVKLGPYCYLCGAKLLPKTDVLEEGDDLDLSSRTLCSDGTCIGVINKEGICKVCGKPYAPAP
jgi:hypothetical protein